MSLCLLAGDTLLTLAVTAFTLSWTHTVEKTAWSEDWRVTPDGLVIASARVEGSGAGMEPPPGAVFDGSGWTYVPDLPPRPRLLLAGSAAGATWRFCAEGTCMEFGGDGQPIEIVPCD